MADSIDGKADTSFYFPFGFLPSTLPTTNGEFNNALTSQGINSRDKTFALKNLVSDVTFEDETESEFPHSSHSLSTSSVDKTSKSDRSERRVRKKTNFRKICTPSCVDSEDNFVTDDFTTPRKTHTTSTGLAVKNENEWETMSNSSLSPKLPESNSQMKVDEKEEDADSDYCVIDSDTESEISSDSPRRPLEDDSFEEFISEIGLGPWREWLNIDENPNHMRDRPQGPPEEPLYPQGEMVETECYVCFEVTNLCRRLCCNFPICDKCLESYLTVQVSQANVNIECLNISCNSYIQRSEISARLPLKMKMKFYKFLIDANVDPSIKTCPCCSSGQQVDKATLKKRAVLKKGLWVRCQRCGLEWCFTCHAPWHKGLTCRDFRKGDALLKDWAREFHYGQINAQKCPKCKIFIQRSLGCDHMTCNRCDTSFCYRCGESYGGFKLLGNHFSRLSPFGCRYNFLPDAPHKRRLIRGAVLGGKLIGGLALSGFVVAAGAVLLGVSVIALPAWGGYKLHKRRKLSQWQRAHSKFYKEKHTMLAFQVRQTPEFSAPALPLPPPALDSSLSTTTDNEDSSDEARERLLLGLQLPDSHRVEVLIHRTVSSSSEAEDNASPGEVTESSVVLTDVVDQAGCRRLVANVYAREKEGEEAKTENLRKGQSDLRVERSGNGRSVGEEACRGNKCDKVTGLEESGVEESGLGLKVDLDSRTPKDSFSQEQNMLEASKRKDNRCDVSLEKRRKEAIIKGDQNGKYSDNSDKSEKKESESSFKPGEEKDVDSLSSDPSQGCFGNIFSKKISALQLPGRRNTLPQSHMQKSRVCLKSATWSKSREKRAKTRPEVSPDVTKTYPPAPENAPKSYTTGVLLRDYAVLSLPADFRASPWDERESGSVASTLSLGGRGEGEQQCSLSTNESFRGSNLSCDIVTSL